MTSIKTQKSFRDVLVLRQVRIPWGALKKGDVFRTTPASLGDAAAEPDKWYLANSDSKETYNPEYNYSIACNEVELWTREAKDGGQPRKIITEPVRGEAYDYEQVRIPMHGTQFHGDTPIIQGGAQVQIKEDVSKEDLHELDISDEEAAWLLSERAKTVVAFGDDGEDTVIHLQPDKGKAIRIPPRLVTFI